MVPLKNTHPEGESPNKRKTSVDHDFSNPQTSGADSQRRKKSRLEHESPGTLSTPAPASSPSPRKNIPIFAETSNSSWAELETFMIGSVQMFPPTLATRQILILRYLKNVGVYSSHALHENIALELMLSYLNIRATKEPRLTFAALDHLASLLGHTHMKRFLIEFLQRRGLEALLEVPRPSIAATGVSLCLYYLGYCEEAMEKVCLLPKYIITNLVEYALWLLECSHDSGRCKAIQFFGFTFQFKVILDEFDAQDGLKKFHNVISTLPMLQPNRDTEPPNQDQECDSRQIVRHVCVAYRRYLEAHLYLKAEVIKRSQFRPNEKPAVSIGASLPPYKACKSSPEEVQQDIELLLQHMTSECHWAPVDQLLKFGDITLLLKIIAFAIIFKKEWNSDGPFHSRGETGRSALEVLAIACVMPKVLLLLCEENELPLELTGYGIILDAAEGRFFRDSDVQKSALRVLVNSVCAPINTVGGWRSMFSQGATNSPSKRIKVKSSEELIQKVWDCVRSQSGILVLIQLMNCKTPITDADSIRMLACKGLAGLARCDTVRQIVSKLPLFTSGELQNLMRDPILQEKRQYHVAFQKYALELLESLSGKTKYGGNLEVSLANIHSIHKANVVAQTKIQFNDRQLLEIVHQHLVTKGFVGAASMLAKEASLSNALTTLSVQHPSKFRFKTNLTPVRTRLSFSNLPSVRALPSTSSSENVSASSSANKTLNNGATPFKLMKKVPQNTTPVQKSRLHKQISSEPHLRQLSLHLPEYTPNEQPRATLDSIITEYLTNQHALCKNPMATCPQFNLFVPHKCPDPKPKLATVNNFAMRCARRQLGYQSKTVDRRFIHSRYCPVETIRSSIEECLFFTCAKFLPNRTHIIVGDYNGDIHIYDQIGFKENSFSAHDNYIVHMEPNRTGELLLISSNSGGPISALWGLKDIYVNLEIKLPFNDENHVEFSKLTQDKIIGTKKEVATIYDVNTGQVIQRFQPQLRNFYTKNKATFDMNDALVLTDGVLFDINSGKEINRLDKLNQNQTGVFHPNGLEIISNTEVWDMRTGLRKLHLLKTVPVLNQCSIIFSPVNSALYAISIGQEVGEGESGFNSSFRTVDSNDYSSIATIEVKKQIYDLSVNCYDTQIALVENQGSYNSVQESVVRLYDVGRPRNDKDKQDDEDMDRIDTSGSGSDNESDGTGT